MRGRWLGLLRRRTGRRFLFFYDDEVIYSEIFDVELIDLQLAQVHLLYQQFSYYNSADHYEADRKAANC